jgi:hypothetical protein
MTEDDRAQATAAMLLEAARDMCVSGDGRVSEADAERLLGYSARYLRQLRDSGRGPAAYPIGVGGGRWSYRIADLAAWIEAAREDFSAMADNGI